MRPSDEAFDRLASEYVLGTLKGGARRRFETWIGRSQVARRAVAEWEDRIGPMALMGKPEAPSARVWKALARHIRETTPATRQAESGWWNALVNNLRLWRGLALVSSVATVLLAVMLLLQPDGGQRYDSTAVAMLTDAQGKPAALVRRGANQRQIVVKLIGNDRLSPERTLELWAVPKQGAPRSLGLLERPDHIFLTLPEGVSPGDTPVLAISIEPNGGSPNKNAPSGPIVFKGEWVAA